jgi:transposase
MTESTDSFSRPSADTVRTTRSIFHIENLYLSIGDGLDSLWSDINWADLDAFGDKPSGHLFLLAMVTAFQFAEKLSDQSAADALRGRTDWKYALHLPLDYPGLDPAGLAEFRRRLRSNPVGQEVFHQLLADLAQIGLLGTGDRGEIPVPDVLAAIECLNRVDELSQAMHLALENLAATHPEWLQANSLPHWVERYGPARKNHHDLVFHEDQRDLLAAFQADIAYLLGAIARSGLPDMARMTEIRTLQALSGEQASRGAVS